ncbi:T9SS type A sorting domain-containing protein [Taibaiella koreensis]|uniref:T9SS type A sorting domain-containing protein n=1 Tax=Taibaiella koreensis TaxID=1268548 RepID=UPI000E59BF5E|nr:T9SS type A sorting domain-containing protein [Taibaiella koreensis]
MLLKYFSFLFACILFSFGSFSQPPQYTINGPLIADGGICSVLDTASFSCALFALNNQNLNYYVDFDFGDGSTGTYTFQTSSYNSSYIFQGQHQYAANGSYLVKAYVRDLGNVLHDSVQLNVTIGNCVKASGTVFYDCIQNCVQDDAELGCANRYHNFFNGSTSRKVYLDSLGKFKLPVYPGESLLPQTGTFDFANAYVETACNTITPITGAVSNYSIPVRLYSGQNVALTMFGDYMDTMICNGSLVDFPFHVNSESNTFGSWQVNFTFGDGVTSNFFTTNGYQNFSHLYNGVNGLVTARIYLYNENYYGPLMSLPKTLSFANCHPVRITGFSDENNDCLKTPGEFLYNLADNADNYTLYSVARNGSNPYQQNTDGTITTLVWPGDTVYRDPQFGYTTQYGPGYYNYFDNIAEAADCSPSYITDALDSVDFAYKGGIDIASLDVDENLNGSRCKGDTLLLALHTKTVGGGPGTVYSLIASYSDGQVDSFAIAPPINDTLTFYFQKVIYTTGYNLEGTFIVKKWDDTYADTLRQNFQINNCGVAKIKAFYDANRNCVRDTGEAFIQNFMAACSYNLYPVALDNETLRFSISASNDTLREIVLSATSQLGKGYYSRYFTPGCSWPILQRDTGYYEIPLIDSVTIVGAGLTNGYNVFPEVSNIRPCDSVFTPTLKGHLWGNRNEQNQFYFAYFDGMGGQPDTVSFLFPDPFNSISAYYYTAGPITTYSYGTYCPGYWLIKGQNDSAVYKYTYTTNLIVSHSCEVPKARLFTDLNGNCTKQGNETALTNITVVVTANGQTFNAVTDINGYIYFNAAEGSQVNITVPQQLTNGQSLSATCMPASTLTYMYNAAGYITYNIPYQCAVGASDYSIIAAHNYWTPGSIDTVYIYPQYSGCSSDAATLSLSLDPALNFLASSLAGQTQTGQVLTWSVANLSALGTAPIKVALMLNSNPSTGSYLCNTAVIMPVQPDLNAVNNTFILCDSVYGMAAPQLKTGVTDSIYLQTGQPVVYTILFKNTSTAPMQVVTVFDTISPLLDINTLQILSASHNYTIVPMAGNVLKFTFSGSPGVIAPGVSGMIRFSLMPAGAITPGTVILNKADIIYNYLGFFATNFTSNSARSVPLRVTLIDISAHNEGTVNKISWRTANESAADYFELERSADGKIFTYLTTVSAKKRPSDYQYVDKLPWQGISYYRLKMLGADHSIGYSKTVTALVGPAREFALTVYPNPTRQYFTLKTSGNHGDGAEIIIYDVAGRQLVRLQPVAQEMTINMSHFANGLYLIKYIDTLQTKTIKVRKE